MQNGFISGMPYLVMWIFAFISGWIVDYLVGPKKMSVTTVRKIFISIGKARVLNYFYFNLTHTYINIPHYL